MSDRDRWINIADKKPPAGEGVLVCADDVITVVQFSYWTDGKEIQTTLNGYGFSGYEWEYDFNAKDITHWRPLPRLPRKI